MVSDPSSPWQPPFEMALRCWPESLGSAHHHSIANTNQATVQALEFKILLTLHLEKWWAEVLPVNSLYLNGRLWKTVVSFLLNPV